VVGFDLSMSGRIARLGREPTATELSEARSKRRRVEDRATVRVVLLGQPPALGCLAEDPDGGSVVEPRDSEDGED